MRLPSHLAFSRAIAVVCILTMVSACNLAAQEQEEEGESQYASQSQALGGGAGGALAGTPRL